MNGVAEVIRNKQDRDAMLRRSLERNIQLYTDKAHFIYELLQNAEDARATRIRFVQYSDRIEVFHDGRPFTEENLQGICNIGLSDKAGNLNQIGEFGVGFKSVFGICEDVRLYSSPSHFKGILEANTLPEFAVVIKDFVLPENIPFESVGDLFTTRFVFPYTVGLSFSSFKSMEQLNHVLSTRLQNLGISTLLFMKHLKLIEYQIQMNENTIKGEYLLEKIEVNDHFEMVYALGNSSNQSKTEDSDESISYMKFSRALERFPGRTVDIAFPIKETNSAIECVKSKDPFISVYFPTETESKLDFIVQGPYRTTPNRSSIPADDEDNIYLANETAKLLKTAITELIEKNQFNMTFVKNLPFFAEAFEYYDLFYPLYTTVRNCFKFEKVIPCNNGEYIFARQAKIARQEKLTTVFNNQLLTELINDDIQYRWLSTSLTETSREYGEVYRFFHNQLKIEVIAPEDVRKYFDNNDDFLKNRDNDWFVELYNVFQSVPAVFSKTRSANMLCSKIIKTTKGDIVAPYRKEEKNYILNVFIKNTKFNTFDINYVDEDLFKRCKTFFTDVLGVTPPPEYEIGFLDLKTRYENGDFFDEQKHPQDIRFLLKYLKNEDYYDEVENFIKNNFTLRCTDGKMHNPNIQNVYFPKYGGINFEMYFRNVANRSFFVDFEYYEKNKIDEQMLIQLGVLNSIIIGENTKSGVYETGYKRKSLEWWTSGDFRWKFSLNNLKNVVKYISEHPNEKDSIIKSQILLQILFENESCLCGKVHISGSLSDLECEYCEMLKILRKEEMLSWSGKWLYTESGELVSPREISKNDLSVAYYGPVKSESKVYDYLGFKKTKADELNELKELVPSEKLEAYFENELMMRFGISAKDLEEKYGSTRTEGLDNEEVFTFPASKVKNWEALTKHVKEMLFYADPVKYSKVVRSIRTSQNRSNARAYIKNMYRYDDTYRYACQLCHDSCVSPEAVNIFLKAEYELDPMYLCLCPNCSAEYKKIRSKGQVMDKLKRDILSKDANYLGKKDYLAVNLDYTEIWFTQTHFAEIQELMKMINEMKENRFQGDNSVNNVSKDDNLSWLDQYVGKRIKRNHGSFEGVISRIEGKYVYIRVKEGTGYTEEKPYLLSAIFKEDGIYSFLDD